MVGGRQERRAGRRPAVDLGLFIVFGAGLGTLLFALTGDVLWVAIGPSIGILVGSVAMARSQRRSDRG